MTLRTPSLIGGSARPSLPPVPIFSIRARGNARYGDDEAILQDGSPSNQK
jgi:hypothetical protein